MNIGTQQVGGRKKLPCRGIPSRIPWVTNGLTFWGLPTLLPAQEWQTSFQSLKSSHFSSWVGAKIIRWMKHLLMKRINRSSRMLLVQVVIWPLGIWQQVLEAKKIFGEKGFGELLLIKLLQLKNKGKRANFDLKSKGKKSKCCLTKLISGVNPLQTNFTLL